MQKKNQDKKQKKTKNRTDLGKPGQVGDSVMNTLLAIK